MKTTLRSLAILLSCLSCFAQGPDIEWQHALSSSLPGGIMKSPEGNYTLLTHNANTIIFNVYNPQGEEIATYEYTGASSVTYYETLEYYQDAEGNYIISTGTLMSDGGLSDTNNLMKFDSTGNLIWNKVIAEANFGPFVPASGGGVFMTSFFGHISKFNEVGDIIISSSAFENGMEFYSCINETSDGGLIISGLNYENDEVATTIVRKLASPFELEWEYYSEGEGYANNISQTSDGGYIFTDYASGVSKLDDTGQLIWSHSYGGTGYALYNSVIQTTDGGFCFLAETTSADGDVSFNHGSLDVWVVKLDPEGDIEWEKCYGGTDWDGVANGEWHINLIEDIDGGFVFCGLAESQDDDLPDNPGQKSWIVKLAPYTLSITAQSKIGGLLYPNPSNGVVTVESLDMFDQIDIYNVSGQRLQSVKVPLAQKAQIDLIGLPPGIYLAKVHGEGHSYNRRVVKK